LSNDQDQVADETARFANYREHRAGEANRTADGADRIADGREQLMNEAERIADDQTKVADGWDRVGDDRKPHAYKPNTTAVDAFGDAACAARFAERTA